MSLLRRLLLNILDRIIARFPEPAAGAEPTLPVEIRNTLAAWRKRAAEPGHSAPKREGGGVLFHIRNFGAVQLARWRRLPRIMRLLLLGSIPPLFAYFALLTFYTGSVNGAIPETARKEGPPLLRIVFVSEWESSQAVSRLIGFFMRNTLGVEVLFKPVSVEDVAGMWRMLALGQADLCASAWLPRTHRTEAADLRREVEDLGPFLTGARMGLVVPDYVEAESIEDLRPEDFGGVVYGIDPDSRLNALTRKVLEDYGLEDFKIEQHNERLMIQALEEALEKKERVVIACWMPHWRFGEHKLKFLADPLRVFGEPEDIHMLLGKDFGARFPQIRRVLLRIRISPQQMCGLMAQMRRERSQGQAVQDWIVDNSALVSGWLRPEGE